MASVISKAVIPFRLITFDVVDTLIQFRTAPGKQYGEFGALFGVISDDNLLVSKFKSNWCVDRKRLTVHMDGRNDFY